MNAKQKRFCDEYLIDLNATQAAIRAGYSEKTARQIGQKMLSIVDVRAYIDEQLELIHTEKTADAREVLEYFTAVLRNKNASEKDRLKAAELLGKYYGLFTEKMELSGKDGGAIKTETQISGSVKAAVDFSKLSDEELEQLEQLVGKIAEEYLE